MTSAVIDGLMTSRSKRSIDSRSASLRPKVAKGRKLLPGRLLHAHMGGCADCHKRSPKRPCGSAIEHARRAPHLRRGPLAASAQSGRSSGVEHNLAKVGVEGSNPFARSSIFNDLVANPRPGENA